MLRKAESSTSKAQVIREAADAVEFEKLPTRERNTAIRVWVDQRFPDFGWSINPSALISGALKSKRWRAHRSGSPSGNAAQDQSVECKLEPALMLAIRAGGFAQAREQLQQIEANPLLEFILSAGGIARALKLLDVAESRVYCLAATGKKR